MSFPVPFWRYTLILNLCEIGDFVEKELAPVFQSELGLVVAH
jgi:hypothetical protein